MIPCWLITRWFRKTHFSEIYFDINFSLMEMHMTYVQISIYVPEAMEVLPYVELV